ncbi:MAG: hypothetical protein RIM33_06970 [Alphaproteobacteria bacterium]
MRSMIGILTAFLVALSSAATVPAQDIPLLVEIDVEDPFDGSHWTGVRLASENRQAFLFLFCDDDNTNPRIVFAHGQAIHDPTKPIGYEIAVDGAESETHYFTVLPNRNSAVFFVRTAQMYEDRFGTSPPVFNEQTRAVNPQYIAWTDNIYNHLTQKLFFGEIASFRFTDGNSQPHGYSFRLLPLSDHIGRLRDCYEPPWVF